MTKKKSKPKEDDVSLTFFLLFGLVILFYNQITAFFFSFGFVDYQANLIILGIIMFLTYLKTPWIKTMMGRD